MFSSRAQKVAKISEEIAKLRAALQKRSSAPVQLAMTTLERMLDEVEIEGEGEEVVRAGLDALAAARPELAKLRAAEKQQLEARNRTRLQQIAQPCVRCGAGDIFVAEGAQIIVGGHRAEEVSDDQLVCNVLVCASCGDVRMIANVADVAVRRFFARTQVGSAPYR